MRIVVIYARSVACVALLLAGCTLKSVGVLEGGAGDVADLVSLSDTTDVIATDAADTNDVPVVIDAADAVDAPTAVDVRDVTGDDGAPLVDVTDVTLDADALIVVDSGPTDSNAPVPPVQISNMQFGPAAIAADGTNVYWVTCAGDVMITLASGSTATSRLLSNQGCGADIAAVNGVAYVASRTTDSITVVTATRTVGPVISQPGGSRPTGIAVNATDVYWTNQGSGTVMRLARSGNVAAVFAAGQAMPTDIALDATNAYWTNAADGTVMRQAFANGSAIVLARAPMPPSDVAVFNGNVYWVANAGSSFLVMTAPTTASGATGVPTAMVMMQGTQPSIAIAVDARGLFVADSGGSNPNGQIVQYPFGNGMVVIANGQATPRGIALDPTRVFWTNGSDGTVWAATR